MYKLKINDNKYEVYNNNLLALKVNNANSLYDSVDIFLSKIYLPDLEEALKTMYQNNHNVAEFGVKGYLTVTYKE